MNREPGLRQRKRDELRAQLHRAATRLFLERGFDETTIDDIVEDAAVSRRTFFRYFDTKEDAWYSEPEMDQTVIVEAVEGCPASESSISLARRACRSLMSAHNVDSFHGMQRARLTSVTPALRAKRATFRERNARALAHAIAKRTGHTPDDLAVTVIASTTVWTIAGAIDRWIFESGKRPLDLLIDEAFTVADAAFAADHSLALDGATARSAGRARARTPW